MKHEHLKQCQVETPREIVDLVWRLALARRKGQPFPQVLDLGAGDARFARFTAGYGHYVGVEFDKKKAALAKLPPNADLVVSDAMKWSQGGFDLCVGNPPYIRHHNLEPAWRDEVVTRLERESGVAPKRTANLFVLFLLQALLRTADDGLVVQLIPFEWVTRPSALELRELIDRNGWSVSVYRFSTRIFSRVLTTASVTIIDKRGGKSRWEFGEIAEDGAIKPIPQASGSTSKVLTYERRSQKLHGLRGLSPGGQDIFVLTDEERLHYSLHKRRDVVPCVTTLRHLPSEVHVLDDRSFQEHYVGMGKRCWLIRTDREELSDELQAYLARVGERWQQYSTCTGRTTWWQYRPHPAPALLFSSGFVGKSTKVLVNKARAIAVGSVYGVIADESGADATTLASRLRGYDFRRRLVSHSNNLKKIEVNQLNAVLTEIM